MFTGRTDTEAETLILWPSDAKSQIIDKVGRASLVAQLVKNLPAVWETWVRSLGWEDSLEKGTANPLQYSDLENSMDCIVHGVTNGLTETEQLSLSLIC